MTLSTASVLSKGPWTHKDYCIYSIKCILEQKY